MTTPRGPSVGNAANEATGPSTDRPAGEVPENPDTPSVPPSENPPVDDNSGGGGEENENESEEPTVPSPLLASAERVRNYAWREFQDVDYISKFKYNEIENYTPLTEASTAIQIKRATMNLKMFNVMMVTCMEVLGMDMECPTDQEEEFLNCWKRHQFRDVRDLVVVTLEEF